MGVRYRESGVEKSSPRMRLMAWVERMAMSDEWVIALRVRDARWRAVGGGLEFSSGDPAPRDEGQGGKAPGGETPTAG